MHILVPFIAYYSSKNKNGDIFVPPHPDGSKTGVPIYNNGNGTGGGRSDGTYCQLFQL